MFNFGREKPGRMKYISILLFSLSVILFACGNKNTGHEIMALQTLQVFLDNAQKMQSPVQEIAYSDTNEKDTMPPTPPVVKQIHFIPPIITAEDDEVVEELVMTQQGYENEVIGVETSNEPYITNEDDVYTFAEVMPEFPGGETELQNYLQKNIEYPEMAKEMGITGKVWIRFTVDKTGDIKDIKVLRGIGGGCDEEAKRVASKMPDWTPGKMGGRNVSVIFTLPINFILK